MNCFCRQGLKRVYGRVSLDTSSESTVVPDSILKIDLNPTSVQPSLFYNASLGLRIPGASLSIIPSNLLPSLFPTLVSFNPSLLFEIQELGGGGNRILKLKQNEEQTKMKLCWKVYAHNRILTFHIMFQILFHILLPVLFQVFFFLLQVLRFCSISCSQYCSKYPSFFFSLKCICNHTLPPRLYFLLSVSVILSRITGVCCSKKQQHRSVEMMLTCSCGLRGCMQGPCINTYFPYLIVSDPF